MRYPWKWPGKWPGWYRWERLPLADAVQAGIETFADAYRTDEPTRMIAEFLEAQAARRERGVAG